MADKAAREATVTPTAHILVALPLPVTSTVADYTAADKKDQVERKGIYRKDGWLHKAGHTIIPRNLSDSSPTKSTKSHIWTPENQKNCQEGQNTKYLS